MVRRIFSLESIPENEEVEFEGFSCITPTGLDVLTNTALENPYYSDHHTTLTPNAMQIPSQASVPSQPLYNNTIEGANIPYPHHYSSLSSSYNYTPPYLQVSSPSPSPPSSFHAAPTLPYSTVLDDHTPHQTQDLLDAIKKRTQARLNETDLSDNFFTKWAIVSTNMYGGVIPPDAKFSIPPFALPSYDGHIRLRFIARCLGFSFANTPLELEKFLIRNLVIITCLVYNIVPNPTLIFDDDDNFRCGVRVSRPGGKRFNEALLTAIQQLEWTDPDVVEAVRLSMTDEVGALATLCKSKEEHILPDVLQKMDDMVWEEPALENLSSRKLHDMAVERLRENRPHSLLRNVVRLEDIIV
jgi:hypothetical protein